MSNVTTLQTNIPDTMKAIVLETPNEQLSLAEVQWKTPTRTGNELLVKVEYVGLNPLDGQYAKTGFCQWQYPHILGLDAVGTVVDAPKGVFPTVGDRVMWHASLADQGVLSEYTTVPNYAVSVVPDDVEPCQAATLPCAGMTALIALEKLQIIEGDTLLIEAGAGAVGHFAIQFAKQRGADVFTTAAKHNHKRLKRLGADAVFDYREEKLCHKICHELGPQGFDAILDSIGGDATIRNLELMGFCGRIACLQALPEIPQALLFKKAPNICIVSLGGAWLENSLCAQQHMSFMSNLLLNGVADGSIILPEIHLVDFKADAISIALKTQLAGGFTGKQIVSF
ncbi:zinc-binding dehydrogenase [Thalassotalea sp. 1_MG-2023]|uniref:zinc-binding dehydrogenase n=1 Tax=Thalassotalea sp. 1_MG-2023 TaxID=3062680 RepID=UPI0026E12906|nr:zinc-binding dehydrogenase [Thalassotalea sp. 1_MG-2023]MDO6427571.1 zinc-binding dehydrogenase [Thalassotalea sp. 1_MG-2023]